MKRSPRRPVPWLDRLRTAGVRSIVFQYDRHRKRLHVTGTSFEDDRHTIRSLVHRGPIPVDVDAIIYCEPDCTMIVRGRHLRLLLAPEGSI